MARGASVRASWVRVGVVLFLGALVAALPGCNRAYEVLGPYSLGFDGGRVLVGVCSDMKIEHVRVAQVQGRGAGVYHLVWEADGTAHVRVGDVLSSGDTPGLTTSELAAATPEPGTTYWLDVNDVSRPELSAKFEIPDGGLAVGDWLTPTGIVQNEPCNSGSPSSTLE